MILIIATAMTIIAASPWDIRFANPEVGIFLVDLAILAAFLVLAVYAERYWTLWICAMQVIQVLSHLPIIFIPELLPQAYFIIVAIWAYPMLMVLALGTYRHQQRLRQFGADKSWSDFSVSQK
ncbi:hypothetical protein [Parasphingorhabdus sp.]